MNYLVSDILIRIKNSYRAGHRELTVPYSKIVYSLCKILTSEGFIEKAEVEKDKKKVLLKLKFNKRKPAMTDLRVVSKPSLRIYVNRKKIPRVLGNLGIAIVSTSKGLMTGREARKKSLGGELLCEIW